MMQQISLTVEDVLRFVGLLFDVVGVIVIVIGFFVATVSLLTDRTRKDSTRQYRIAIGRALAAGVGDLGRGRHHPHCCRGANPAKLVGAWVVGDHSDIPELVTGRRG